MKEKTGNQTMNNSMDQKLKLLFDYQSFENNSELLKLKKESEERYSNVLSEEDLAFVNAAGEFEMVSPEISGNKEE